MINKAEIIKIYLYLTKQLIRQTVSTFIQWTEIDAM